ncbi:MAG: PepSY-like domain-containing protein [Bacteroidales bacterium]|nr:PepSY-like domain-containing protein [Bacteroidales bacterium]MDZ4205166.1 PepSY-like domain-containing protein [Bacteroidales bacterium]
MNFELIISMKCSIQYYNLLFFTLFVLTATSQNAYHKIPEKARAMFVKMHPNVTEVEWSDNFPEFLVSFYQDKNFYESFFDRPGKWLRTEHIIEYDELPEIVALVFYESGYSEYERGYVYKVEMPRKKIRYKIYVYDSNWNELELVYDAKGKMVVDN